MIYGTKEEACGTTMVYVKNEYGFTLYSESFGGTQDQVQILGSGDSVTVLADVPGHRVGKLITLVDQTTVDVTVINY